MIYTDLSCKEFTAETAGKAPVPGGGSVSALVGALGSALGAMVGSLTIGKKKYADVEDEIKDMTEKAQNIREELLNLVQADIDIFEPLSALYGMKADTETEKAEKERLMEDALDKACAIPLNIMEQCAKAIDLSGEFAEKGSRLAVSDAGASAIICKAAMRAASLNVYINTKSMKNKEHAVELNNKCAMLLEKYTPMAEKVFLRVEQRLKGDM